MSKSGGTLYIGVPPLQILGGRVPPSPKVYASASVFRFQVINEQYHIANAAGTSDWNEGIMVMRNTLLAASSSSSSFDDRAWRILGPRSCTTARRPS